MLSFEKIKSLRDRLVGSLVQWQSPKDGFYRSSPIVKVESSPSFTNTGIVLQAFTESGQNHLAQALADKLIEYLKARDYAPFPNEKGTLAEPKAHIMCNSWPVFAILDCYPSRVHEFDKIYHWFIKTQKKEGDWNLLPGEETRYPIFSAYALSALLQFYDCHTKTKTCQDPLLEDVKKGIALGFDFLHYNRTPGAIQEGLLLWPASLNNVEEDPISFCTSAICMHMLAKASRLLNRRDWESGVEKTFRIICDSFNQEEFLVSSMKINIWDEIHVNESSLNYFFDFFAPINLTTLLRFSTYPSFRGNTNYYNFVCYLTNWIVNNVVDVQGHPGIRGSEKRIADVKTWSTAFAVIVLSRILNQAYALRDFEQNKGYQEIIGILKTAPALKRYKVLVPYYLIIVSIAVGVYLLVGDRVQGSWSKIEGKWSLISVLLATFIALTGLNIPKLRDRILAFFYGALIRLVQIRKLEQLCKELGIHYKSSPKP